MVTEYHRSWFYNIKSLCRQVNDINVTFSSAISVALIAVDAVIICSPVEVD